MAGEYVLAYQVGKLLGEVASIGLTYMHNHQEGADEWQNFIQPVTDLVTALETKQYAVRDALKVGSQITTQLIVQQKLLNGLNGLFSKAADKVVAFARKNPLAHPEELATTPEGILVKACEQEPPYVDASQPLEPPAITDSVDCITNCKWDRVTRKIEFTRWEKEGIEINGTKYFPTEHFMKRIISSGRKDINPYDIIEAIEKGVFFEMVNDCLLYINPKTEVKILVGEHSKKLVSLWPKDFKINLKQFRNYKE